MACCEGCEGGELGIDGWPQGSPADINVKNLPAAGATTNPFRIPGKGKWIGIWGNFSGLFIGTEATGKAFPARSGIAIPWPGGDRELYLSQSGGTGNATFGRFATREAALAWAGIAAGVASSGGGGAVAAEGTDVTLGTFIAGSGAAVQIALAGSVMPVAGATIDCKVFLNAKSDNTGEIYVGETAALAVASNGVLGAAGADVWNIPAGGKLFMLGSTVAVSQTLGARVRS